MVLHPLVMGLLKNWRETTAYARDENFIFASDRLNGKQPRVPNMLVEDHLRPAAKQVIDIPDGQRFGFHNLRHALTSFLVEIGTDAKTLRDMLRWAGPSILLKVYAHSRMDKRMEAQAKMIVDCGTIAYRFIDHTVRNSWAHHEEPDVERSNASDSLRTAS